MHNEVFTASLRHRGGVLALGVLGATAFLVNMMLPPPEGSLPEDGLAMVDAPAERPPMIDATPLLSARDAALSPPVPPEPQPPAPTETAPVPAADVHALAQLLPDDSPSAPAQDPAAQGEVIAEGREVGVLEVRGWRRSTVRALLEQGGLVYLVRSEQMGDYVLRPQPHGRFAVDPAQHVAGLSQIEMHKDVHIVHSLSELTTALRLGSPARDIASVMLVFSDEVISPLLATQTGTDPLSLSLCLAERNGAVSVERCETAPPNPAEG